MTTRFAGQDSEFLVNSETLDFQYEPTITGLVGGGYVITWRTQDTTQDGSGFAIKAQIYDASGTAQGNEFLVNSETYIYQYKATVTGLPNGGFVVAWTTEDTTQDGDGSAIKARIFDAAGVAADPEFLVNSQTTGFQYRPQITGLASGGFVVSWETNDATQDGEGLAIKAQVYDALGASQGSEFLVNSETAGNQIDSFVTGLVGGGFVIVWTTEDTAQDGNSFAIKAQVYDALGAAQGTEFLVNSEVTGQQSYPVVTGLTGGGFVIAWTTTDGTQDGSAYAIKAQLYDANGVAQGTEFLVNSEAQDIQVAPTISNLATGGFVIAWYTTDAAQDGDGYAIKGQAYDALGIAIDGEFLVNTQSTGNQFFPAVAGLENGDFVVAWETHDTAQDGSSTAIKARMFADQNEPAVAGESHVFVLQGKSARIDVLSSASDVDGNSIFLTEFEQPSGGRVTRDNMGSDDTTADDVLVFSSGRRFRGDADFSYTITDEAGARTTDSVDITVIAQSHVFSGDGGNNRLMGTRVDDALIGKGGKDVLRGKSGDDWLKGGGSNDRLVGGAGNDRLEGGGGSDTLFGGSDNDWLDGGDGTDRLTGGTGFDVLVGGALGDQFIFNQLADSAVGEGRDQILDFETGEGADIIDLRRIDAGQIDGDQAFTFIASQAFTQTEGEVRFEFTDGNTLIQADQDGDGVADMEILLIGVIQLTAVDFLL